MIIQSVYRIYSNPPAEVAPIDPTEGRIELMLIKRVKSASKHYFFCA